MYNLNDALYASKVLGIDFSKFSKADCLEGINVESEHGKINEVTNVTDDTLLGKTIEIRNSTELIMVYQSLGEVLVKKGDTISQGQIIGKSGTCKLNSEIKQGLHFEIYKNGQVINPEKIYGKQLKELSEN